VAELKKDHPGVQTTPYAEEECFRKRLIRQRIPELFAAKEFLDSCGGWVNSWGAFREFNVHGFLSENGPNRASGYGFEWDLSSIHSLIIQYTQRRIWVMSPNSGVGESPSRAFRDYFEFEGASALLKNSAAIDNCIESLYTENVIRNRFQKTLPYWANQEESWLRLKMLRN
jgi:hypothetical protein